MAAEEVPQFRNKGLLLVAVILGGVVVIIYHVHINRVRASLEGKRIMLLKYTRSMTAGEKIDRKDLIEESIRRDDAMALGNVMESENQSFAVGRRLRLGVNQGEWVQWNHVTGRPQGMAKEIGEGMVGIVLQLDARTSPGPLCRPGDRVNILGRLQISPDQPPRIFRIIQNVEVLSTGAETIIGETMEVDRRTPGSYRSVAIEVTKEVSKQLYTLFYMAQGSLWLEVLPPNAPFDPKKHGIINPEEPVLQQLLQSLGTTAA